MRLVAPVTRGYFFLSALRASLTRLRRERSVSIRKKYPLEPRVLVLLYQVKLNIARQNGYGKQNIILPHFLANKPRRELSGVRKKRKTFCTLGTIRENAELSPARQNIAANHYIH